jgi:hypothetical protein
VYNESVSEEELMTLSFQWFHHDREGCANSTFTFMLRTGACLCIIYGSLSV